MPLFYVLGGGIVGALVAHLFSGVRDRRKEFNDAAAPIREWLLGEIEHPSPNTRRPSAIEIDAFMSRLSTWQRFRFRRADERQQRAREQASWQDATGEVLYTDDAMIIKHLRACLRYTVRK